jgi:nucleoside-diphosphate-sugar epimerase
MQELEMAADSPVLVTGASGLIGHAVHRLLAKQGRPVVAVDRAEATIEGLGVEAADIGSPHRLHALAARHRFDAILHCGAFSGPMVARDDPTAIVAVNIVGTANVLELARVHGIRRVVFCSSVSAYGSTPEGLEPVSEETPLHPSSVYGASKAAGEALVDGYVAQHGVDGVSLRLSWVYGPRRMTDCAIREMVRSAQAGRPHRLPFGRDFHRQYVHVEDAARALALAMDAPRLPRRSYNVTGGSYATLGEIAGIVTRVVPGADIEVAPGPDPVDDRQARFDIGAAARDLGYRPQIGLEEGIAAYADWLCSQAGQS